MPANAIGLNISGDMEESGLIDGEIDPGEPGDRPAMPIINGAL